MVEQLWCVQIKRKGVWEYHNLYGIRFNKSMVIYKFNEINKHHTTWVKERRKGHVRAVKCKVVVDD